MTSYETIDGVVDSLRPYVDDNVPFPWYLRISFDESGFYSIAFIHNIDSEGSYFEDEVFGENPSSICLKYEGSSDYIYLDYVSKKNPSPDYSEENIVKREVINKFEAPRKL